MILAAMTTVTTTTKLNGWWHCCRYGWWRCGNIRNCGAESKSPPDSVNTGGGELIPPIRLPKYHPPNCHQYPVVDSLSDGWRAPPFRRGYLGMTTSHGLLATTREEDGAGMSPCGTLQYKRSQGGKKKQRSWTGWYNKSLNHLSCG